MGRYFSLASISALERDKLGTTTSLLLSWDQAKISQALLLGREVYTWSLWSDCLMSLLETLDPGVLLPDGARAP